MTRKDYELIAKALYVNIKYADDVKEREACERVAKDLANTPLFADEMERVIRHYGGSLPSELIDEYYKVVIARTSTDHTKLAAWVGLEINALSAALFVCSHWFFSGGRIPQSGCPQKRYQA